MLPASESQPASKPVRWLAFALAASLAAVVALTYVVAKPVPPPPVWRTTVRLSQGLLLPHPDGCLALSPDGRTLAFSASAAGQEPQLFVRRLDNLTPQPLPGTDGARYPFWSPDGATLGFFAGGRLKRVPAAGGSVTAVCEASDDARGGTWGPDGTIVFAPGFIGPLRRVPAAGGKPQDVTAAPGRVSHVCPHFLADGRRVLYTQLNSDADGVLLLDLKTGTSARVCDERSEALPAADEWLVFARGGNLLAQRFESGAGKPVGEAKPLAENVLFDAGRGAGAFTVSSAGTLVYLSDVNERQLEWYDLEGRSLGQVGPAIRTKAVSLSPLGDRVLVRVSRGGERYDLWSFESLTGKGTKFLAGAEPLPSCFSPDGQWVAYAVRDGASLTTHLRPVAAAGGERLVGQGWPADWSRDAQWISLDDQPHGSAPGDVWCARADGSQPRHAVACSPAHENGGLFSPDGRWLLYSSDQTGRSELFAAPVPGPGPARPITSGGGITPLRWLADGRVIYVDDLSRNLWALPVTERAGTVQIGTPVQLFGERRLPDGPVAVTGDGRRLIVAVPVDVGAPGALTLVQNWAVPLLPKRP